MRVIVIFISVILFSSCDEINKLINPSDDYLLDKSISASQTEQTFESGSEFKMIFPANSISGDLEVKVKKESSVPAMNIPNQKPGKNFYRIKFSGDTDFLKPIKIFINYDKSAIPTGKTAQESVFGYIYSSGAWKLANFEIDEPNGKIIISISSIFGKTKKDEPILLDEREIIIGSTYTTTDTGENDDALTVYKYLILQLICSIDKSDGSKVQGGFGSETYNDGIPPKITWNGKNFTVRFEKIVPKDLITEYTTEPDSTIEQVSGIAQYINGENGKDDIITIVKLNYDWYNVQRTYWGIDREPDISVLSKKFALENLKISILDPVYFPYAYPFEEVTDSDIGNYITNVTTYWYQRAWYSDGIIHEWRTIEQNSVSFNFDSKSIFKIEFRKKYQ